MKPSQKLNLPVAIASIVGGGCLAISATQIITNKPDYPVIAQTIIFTGWLGLWVPILYILFEKWVVLHLIGISRRDIVVQVVLSLSVSALVVFMTPIRYQLYSPRKTSLEIKATAQNNLLSTGNEIGILTASLDGVVIPWSEFLWEGGWDKIDNRPYFNDVSPAQLTWEGYTREGALSLSLISSSSTGILEVKLNGVKHTFDSYENSGGSIRQIDFPAFQKDWRWAVFSLTLILAIGILIFIGTGAPYSFFVILITIAALITNLTVFQKNSPLPPLRPLQTSELDQVAVNDQLWAINDRYISSPFGSYLYPTLRGATIISTPELIMDLTNPNLRYEFDKSGVSLYTPDKAALSLVHVLALKEYRYLQYDCVLTNDELAVLEQQPFLKWDLSTGGKFIVFPDSKKKIYVIMKYEDDALSYYFVPIETATRTLKRDFE